MIKIDQLTIQYGNNVIIDHCDFYAKKGIFYVVTGKSGCGKSSLLQVLGLLQTQTSNSFTIGGYEINDDDHRKVLIRKEKIGYVFQEKNLHDALSVIENLRIYGYLVDKEIDENQALDLLKQVNLKVPLTQKVYKLSGGEKQRLAVACALIKQPEILLADEPSSGLDKANEDQLIELFKNLAHERKLCVIIVSHSPTICQAADELVTIENRKLHQQINDHKEEKFVLDDHKISMKFYWYYIKRSFSVNNHIRILISILLALITGITLSTLGIQKAMVQSQHDRINSITNNNVIVSMENSFTDKDLEYYGRFKNVEDIQYYHNYQQDGYILQSYTIGDLGLDEAVVTKGFAFRYNVEVGDYFYYEGLDTDFKIIEILEEESINDFSTASKSYLFISKDHLDPFKSNQLILTVDSFDHVSSVIENIKAIKGDLVLVKDGGLKNIIYNQLQVNFIEYMSLFVKILFVIVFGMFVYIEVLELFNHKYEYAMLRTNGLTKNELIKEIFISSILQGACLIVISEIFMICCNYIYSLYNYLELNEIMNYCIFVIPLIVVVKLISNIAVICYVNNTEPLILIKK